jgi:hypothetical protein
MLRYKLEKNILVKMIYIWRRERNSYIVTEYDLLSRGKDVEDILGSVPIT